MAEQPGVVIVGAGQAGGELAFTLRSKGYPGSVTLIGREPHLPYQRPPLSKDFLLGKTGVDSLFVRPASAYDKHDIDRLLDVEVTHIDRTTKAVICSTGEHLAYDKLVLATGGTARKCALPGSDKPNAYSLRSMADAERLQRALDGVKTLVIVGGGYIGLEIAAAATTLGVATTILEAAPRILTRTTGPEVATFFEEQHRGRGVDVRTSARVVALHGDTAVDEIELAGGERLACDAVIFGIGLIPETTLASNAGLDTVNGVRVDTGMRTSDPDILAVGDCAESEHTLYDRHIRLESVPNALEQARVAAATICGDPVEYTAVPWFWSDQYDLKFQAVGLSTGYDEVVIRGCLTDNSFLACYLKRGEVISVDAVNRPAEFMVAKRLIKQRASVDRAALADDAVPLKSLLRPT